MISDKNLKKTVLIVNYIVLFNEVSYINNTFMLFCAKMYVKLKYKLIIVHVLVYIEIKKIKMWNV